MEYILRPYQVQAIEALDRFRERGGKAALMVLPTGTGKRYLSVKYSENFSKRILFLCHTEELIEQAFNELEEFYPMQCGIIKAERFDIDKRVIVASAQTMWRRLDKLPFDFFQHIITDEAHHYVSEKFVMPLNHFNYEFMTAWTATPTRLDGLNFSNIVDEIVFNYGIEQAIPDGWLCELDAYRCGTQTDISKIHRVAGDFNQKELSEKIDTHERNLLIVDKYTQYASGRQFLAFCCDIEHAYHLRDAFRYRNIQAETICSDETRCPNRKELNNAYKRGEIIGITNVNTHSEGWDYADVSCIIMARPTQSLSRYIQSIGRGTRIKSQIFQEKFQKNDCIILDIVDNVGKHKLVNTWTIEKEKPIEQKIFMSKERKEKIIAEKIRKEREMTLRYKHDKRINLLALPKITISTSYKARKDDATERQIAFMKVLGIWQEGCRYVIGQASELISNCEAADWQIKKLRGMGYDVAGGVTVGQAMEVLKRQKEKVEGNKMPFEM